MMENTTELADIKKGVRILLFGNSKFKTIDKTEKLLRKIYQMTKKK